MFFEGRKEGKEGATSFQATNLVIKFACSVCFFWLIRIIYNPDGLCLTDLLFLS
jgi:hypothetical protein